MDRSRAIGVRTILAAAFFFFVFPTFASASAIDITARTTQLLPPGGTSCTAITITSVTPYVYEGSLDSFGIVVPDVSYVAIGGSTGSTIVPFQHMTRRITPDGQLRIHTDLDPTPVVGTMPVSITLLSSKNGVLCAATISFNVAGMNIIPPGPITGPSSGTTYTPPKPATGGGSQTGVQATTAPATTTPVSSLGMCAVQSGALKLWLVLLVLYAGIVAFAAFSKPVTSLKNPAIQVALILVPLILLVGFWYFAPACRAASWVPIALLIIAIASLLAAFREKEASTLLLPGMQRPPMPMPPATTKPSVPTTTTPTPKPVVKTEPKNSHVEEIQKKFEEAQKKSPPKNS